MTLPIAVIDCGVEEPTIKCFNQLVTNFYKPFTYHTPPVLGIDSLIKFKASGYIILGSASHVSENLPWHLELKEVMIKKVNEGYPTLGICFGHQLMAHAFGAEVGYVYKDESKNQGPRNITLLADSHGFAAQQKFTCVVSHAQEVKTLPESFIHLGESEQCKYEMIAHKTLPYLGVQAHPEASRHFMENTLSEKMSSTDTETCLSSGREFLSQFIEFVEKNQSA